MNGMAMVNRWTGRGFGPYLRDCQPYLPTVYAVASLQTPDDNRKDPNRVPVGSGKSTTRGGLEAGKRNSSGGNGSMGVPGTPTPIRTPRVSIFSRIWDWIETKSFENTYGVRPENATTIDEDVEPILRKYLPERAYRDTSNPILKVIRVHND